MHRKIEKLLTIVMYYHKLVVAQENINHQNSSNREIYHVQLKDRQYTKLPSKISMLNGKCACTYIYMFGAFHIPIHCL